mmetsp:Transcript_43387/g.101279  ORF Transcript_43387/g.101279 Transcript_43387/m.101279 type:complete len:351 (+) Transcript_43387:530-1582(+)
MDRVDRVELDHCFLLVELPKNVQSVFEQLLGLSLIFDNLLEFLVLFLAVLACQLQLLLHLSHLACQCLHLALRLLHVDGLLFGEEGGLQPCLVCGLNLILLELLNAEVLLLHLIFLLLRQGEDHVVHGLLHLRELVDLCLHGQRGQARVAMRCLGEHPGSGGGLRLPFGLRLRGVLEEGESFLEVGVGVLGVQDLNGLGDTLGLLRTDLLALVPLGVHLGTLLLHIVHEGQVGTHQRLGVLDRPLLLGMLFVGIRALPLLCLDLRRASLDLGDLGGRELRELRQRGLLVLLEGYQLLREVVHQPIQDTLHAVKAVTSLQEGLQDLSVLPAQLGEVILHQLLQHRPHHTGL